MTVQPSSLRNRAELERDLAEARKQALEPAGRASIEKCVREYAEYEKLLREFIANGPTLPDGSVGGVRVIRDGSDTVQSTCTEAATHLPSQ